MKQGHAPSSSTPCFGTTAMFGVSEHPLRLALTRLCAEGERIDFAFIDGNHRFDYTLVDFFYIDKMLRLGGHVAFDDLWIASVRKVVKTPAEALVATVASTG